jgi:hypothetical protein
MQWSQLKKRIEAHFAESVKNRIKIGSTSYHHAHDQLGRSWIEIDGKEIINMCYYKFEVERYKRYQVNEGDREQIAQNLNENNLFSQNDWHSALNDYLNLSIDSIRKSEKPLIRALGMLDARLGKRSLHKINIDSEHDLVKRLFFLRCDAEGLLSKKIDLVSRVDGNWIKKHKVDPESEKKAEAALKGPKNKIGQDLKDADRSTLQYIEKKSKLLEGKYLQGVLSLLRDRSHWIKPIEEWKPSSHNQAKQFSSLARFLLCEFDVPLFMDQAYLENQSVYQGWFRHIGQGKNIRTITSLPVSITKKEAHYFLEAPDHYSIEGAIRWGQIYALGGNERLADAILETRLDREFDHDDFWQSVLRFFIKNPMLDMAQVNPIVDYIWNQKFANRRIFVERGVAQEQPPEQPNFSMKGRTVESLLKEVEAWHRRLGKEVKGGKLQWEKSPIRDFEFIEGNRDSKNMRIWSIKELVSSNELVAEGRVLKHCVASYAQSCGRGASSIWTMDFQTEDGTEKLLTIEVANQAKLIKQIRGRLNRLATEKEKNIILRWAEKENLKIASYL